MDRLPKEVVLQALKQVQDDCWAINGWEKCPECDFYSWNKGGCLFSRSKYEGYPAAWAIEEYGVRTYEQAAKRKKKRSAEK